MLLSQYIRKGVAPWSGAATQQADEMPQNFVRCSIMRGAKNQRVLRRSPELLAVQLAHR
jgi:hypothetical protein